MIPKFFVRIVQYMVIAGIAGIVSYALLFLFTEGFNIHYLPSVIASYIIAHTGNYLINNEITFKESPARKRRSFPLFMIFGLISLTTITFVTYFLTEHFGLYYLYSRMISSPISGMMNFAFNYFFSFQMKAFFKEDLQVKKKK